MSGASAPEPQPGISPGLSVGVHNDFFFLFLIPGT